MHRRNYGCVGCQRATRANRPMFGWHGSVIDIPRCSGCDKLMAPIIGKVPKKGDSRRWRGLAARREKPGKKMHNCSSANR